VAEAHIPSPVELSSQELTWMANKAAETEIIEVTTGTDQKFEITGLLGVSEYLYEIRKEVVTEGSHYRIHIKPTDKVGLGIQTLQVRTNSPDPRDQVLAVFLRHEEAPTSKTTQVEPKKP
jgi:hypothetical protein